MADVLHDHVHVNRAGCQRAENARSRAWLVRHAHERDLRLILVQRYAAHYDVLHACSFFLHNRSGVGI